MVNRWSRLAALLCLLLPLAAIAAGDDMERLRQSRQGMQAVLAFLHEHPQLLAPSADAIPAPDARGQLRSAWSAFLDHLLALDAVGERASDRYRNASGKEKAPAFRLAFAAFLTEYRYTLALLELTERNRHLHAMLNESLPELGLPQGTYARVKFRFLNLLEAAEFSRMSLIYQAGKRDPASPLAAMIEQDSTYIMALDRHNGPALTVRNAGKVVGDAAFSAWFPVQKGVSEWMGDTKVVRKGESLISAAQLEQLQPRLRPGDVLLVRHEWYLSNVGLPGFWPHAVLYIGTPDERRAYFDDPEVQAWVRQQGEPSGGFEPLLQARESAHYAASLELQQGAPVRTIEAISEGVSLNSLRHAGDGDSLAALRPRLSKVAKARAILRAFHYAGRPYDFDFNFDTDSSLVCTELVYKAYQPSRQGDGLHLPLEQVLGRPVLPANRIARLFDEEFDVPQRQFDFVAFLDGQERQGVAKEADVAAFRSSWRRPKWHILIQDTPLARY